MTSAEPRDRTPQMLLERVVEFSEPIIELSVSENSKDDALIMARTHGGYLRTVHANTGSPPEDDEGVFWRNGFHNPDAVATEHGTAEVAGGVVIIREASGRREQRRIAAHSTPITTLGVCVTEGGTLLMTASEGGSIRLWDMRTGQQLRVGTQQSPVAALVSYAGPDGRPRIASGGADGSLYIWDPSLPAGSPPTGPLPAGPFFGPVATRGFSDRVAKDDLLNRSALASALVDVLEPGEDDGPTVITLEGAWGSGKSTLLEFVRARLRAGPGEMPRCRRLTVFSADRMLFRPPLGVLPPMSIRESLQATVGRSLIVSFNPWRHQSSEQVWAGLAKAIAAAAERALMSNQNMKERYWFASNTHRVDRRHLQRQLWKRIYSPLLTFAGLGFGLSLLGALAKFNITWAWWTTAGLAGLGALHTARRYFFGRASAFLPSELFAGPVVSNAFSAPSTDPLIRDPYYHAKAGYLYLVQHDVKALLGDLADRGYQAVLLIDDLDRCTPRTTAQVFEAINVFLSDDFPTTRFVVGLDSSVVASHVDHAYKELADARIVTHPDDPSPGWTFLRKLVQLPVRLPHTTEDNVDRILLAQLKSVHREEQSATVSTAASADSATFTEPAIVEQVDRVTQVVVAIERHAEVREHLRRRLKAQPEQSVREEKRLLNVWQFYLRVLGSADVNQACHLVPVAEIAVRWPAYLHRLRGGWQDLADAVNDDVQWGAAIAKLGFAYSDRKAAANLRELLRDCDAQAVAGLANRLF